jgi:predicted MFS family arabinose efflux permease
MVALPRRTSRVAGLDSAAAADQAGGYLDVLADRRYVLYLFAALLNAGVYAQHLSTLPLDVKAEGVPLFWYTFALSMNGVLVIAFELPLTKLSQKWPLRLTIGLTFLLVGVGVGCYGLPLGPAVIIVGTLIWTAAEVIGAPTVFAYPAMAGPAHLKGRYIGSFQFMFGLGSAIGPVVGGALFTQLGHRVWPVLAVGGLLAAPLGMAAIRTPARVSAAGSEGSPAGSGAGEPPAEPLEGTAVAELPQG